MKTSVIRYRVADFLRESAPFDGMAVDDVLGFAGTGKVLFHETDVDLFVKGDARQDHIWVIQQGRIEMLDETPSELELKDVLGPGDILGLRSHTADKFYRRTARTASEVILYAFDTGSFETLVSSYPDALRFLRAHLSASTDHTRSLQAPTSKTRALSDAEKPHWLNAKHLPVDCQQHVIQGLRTCDQSASLRDVVKTLRAAQSDRIVIVTPERKPVGYAALSALSESVASGTASFDSPVQAIMQRHFYTTSLNDDPGHCFLTMLKGRTGLLIVTSDGSKDSPVQGCLTASDIELSCGRNPTTIQKAILDSKSPTELAYIWSRAEAFLRENWVGPSVIDWFGTAMSELRDALIERVVDISMTEMGRAGKQCPDTPHAWILTGESGRREFLLSCVDIGIVWADSNATMGAGGSDDRLKYFTVLAQKVTAKLEACGFQKANCHARPIDDWKDFFRTRIQDPIGNKIHASRELFDLAFLRGDSALSTELQDSIAADLNASDIFIPVLVNDTLAKLPPLTFFQGIAIEADGKLNYTLDLENTVLRPIIDASRVLVFLSCSSSISNTIERLGFLRGRYPQYDAAFADAADAWRIAGYHHNRQRFSSSAGNRSIQSAHLSRFDQRTLKTAFDSTRSFIRLACLLSNISPLK